MGEIAGNLVIAGAFLFAAFIVYLATKDFVPVETQSAADELEQSSFSQLPFVDQLFKPDGNLMRSIGSSIGSMAPVAAKAVAERVAPNLHLIIGAAVGLMIASKISEKLDIRSLRKPNQRASVQPPASSTRFALSPRANWKGSLKIAALTCPVALYSATSTSDRIAFHTINRSTGHRVRRTFVDSDTGEPVEFRRSSQRL